MKTEMIPINRIELNEGQLDGVPANPRTWTFTELQNLCKSIQETPELFEARGLIAIPQGDKYVAIGGNMRLVAASAIGMEEVPVYVLPESTSPQKIMEIVMKDNSSFGAWDWDKMAEEWANEARVDWGVSIPKKDEAEERGAQLEQKADAVLEVVFMPDEFVYVTHKLLEDNGDVSEGLLNLLGYGAA